MTAPVRYDDRFLNALMHSHQMTARAELWYDGQLIGPINLVSGSVTADRASSVRRTANLVIDPHHLESADLGPYVRPYGSRVALHRGIRYMDTTVEEVRVFYGRIDSVEYSMDGTRLTCSDLAADVVDARFLRPVRPGAGGGLPGGPTTMLACIKALVSDVHPGVQFNTTGITGIDPPVRPGTTWDQERGDALDSLCTQLAGGCEWSFDPYGVCHIRPLPAAPAPDATPVWVVDTGNRGVMVDRVMTVDRANVFNGVSVTGEPINGEVPAQGEWLDQDPDSPTRWGGPYGKVVNHYTGQQLNPNTTAGAQALARTLGLNSIASVKAVNVTCVPNPKLMLSELVSVVARNADIDGLYFVQSMELPLDPETAMTMILYSTINDAAMR